MYQAYKTQLRRWRLFAGFLQLHLDNLVEQKRLEQIAFAFVELAVKLDPAVR